MPPPWEKIQVISGYRVLLRLKITLAMVRVVSAPYSTTVFRDVSNDVAAAVGFNGMNVDYSLAAVQLFVDRLEFIVPEPDVAIIGK
jgi:hypothetical protein